MDRIQDFEVNSPRWLSLENFEDEVWKDIPFTRYPYQISNMGRIKRLQFHITYMSRNHCLSNRTYSSYILHAHDNGRGYLWVLLDGRTKKRFYIHRLVASSFIPNPKSKPQIDHINTNKYDNRVTNIRWVTKSENMRNPITLQHNKIAQGDPVVLLDCWGEYIGEYFSAQDLADVLGVAASVVKDVITQKRSARTIFGFTAIRKKDYDANKDYGIFYKRGTSPYIYVPNEKMVLVFKQGKLFTVFPNVKVAADAYDANHRQISKICRLSDGNCLYNPTYVTTDTLCYYKDMSEDVQHEALAIFKSKYPPKAYL